MDELIQSMNDFLSKEPEKRFGELMAILNYSENAQAMGALGLVFSACTEEEQLIVSQKLGDSRLENPMDFPLPLIQMFFADARIEAGPDAISELCCSLLGHQDPKLRENTLSLLEQGTIPLYEHTKCQLILMLGDPEEKIRQLAAETTMIYSGPDEMLPERFFSTFYLEDVRAGKFLAKEIETHEDAVMFLYLCFAYSEKGQAGTTDPEFSSILITSLHSSLDKSKIAFPEAASDALELFCARTTNLRQLTKKDKAMLQKNLKKEVQELVNATGGNLPSRFPRPNKTPFASKTGKKAKAKA